jgi:hypothetical protein
LKGPEKESSMNRQYLKYGFIPFLFGFLLLGAMSHQPGHRDHGARTAAPATPPAQAPRLTRAALAQQPDAATIAPLPVYVPEPDDSGCSGIRVCHWST